MRILVVGAGAVGMRAARQLASTSGVEGLSLVDLEISRADAVRASLGPVATVEPAMSTGLLEHHDAVLLCTPGGVEHAALVEQAVAAGVHAVSTADDVDTVRELLSLSPAAGRSGVTVVAGAGFGPGLTCLLTRHAAPLFDTVLEVHVARSGTGGPACAREHHAALARSAVDWRDGSFIERPGGSGRELCWFPDPVGGLDCYRGAMPDALLLQPALPDAERITARMAATRRDRLTSWLPMLRPPHPEGLVGAVRVLVRGLRGRTHETVVYGAMDRPAVAAGAVSAVATVAAVEGRLAGPGAGGLATLVPEPLAMLKELARRGVKGAVFDGQHAA